MSLGIYTPGIMFIEGVLIVAILLLVAYVYKYHMHESFVPLGAMLPSFKKSHSGGMLTGGDPTEHFGCSAGKGCKCPKCASPEWNALMENSEYFAECKDAASAAHTGDTCGNRELSYADNDFGRPDMEFKDWVASQVIEDDVIKNHGEYVKDRLSSDNQLITGRVFTPDMHDSYDPIPWSGLFRPQAVPVCNPTQVPDVDYDLYAKEQTLKWSTGGPKKIGLM
jgi:hypothetical protein